MPRYLRRPQNKQLVKVNKLWAYILERSTTNAGAFPSVREMGRYLNASNSVVASYLDILSRMGLIEPIELAPDGRAMKWRVVDAQWIYRGPRTIKVEDFQHAWRGYPQS